MQKVHDPLRVLNLLLDMGATKSGYRALVSFWAEMEREFRAHGVPLGFELPTRAEFDAIWDDCARPLDLHARRYGAVNGLYWPLASWAAYVTSKPVFRTALKRGDAQGYSFVF